MQNDWQHDSGSWGFLAGLATGVLVGASVGMLFAPKRGSELRSQLNDSAHNLGAKASRVKDKASEGYHRASESVREFVGRS
ncbi:MAG: YtxH domain-containing protein, partial [Vicinamibacteraceae bacterium]|nr:YtxH domain-containing protein [Vicinamibacteraceae bacterium]